MTRTPSTMIPLGTIAPDFTLIDCVTGAPVQLQAVKSSVATVIIFMCNHCPFVQHILDRLVKITEEYIPLGIKFIAINSNDAEQFPADAPEKMQQLAQNKNFQFPYLFDATQDVAKAYHAACTPDFYIFDKALACVYRGQFDDSRPGNDIPMTGNDLRHALDKLLAGEEVDPQQKPSLGCNIKWKN